MEFFGAETIETMESTMKKKVWSGLESGGMWQPGRVRAREWWNVAAREDLSSRLVESGGM